MTKRILIMGLPGAGKTTLAEELRDVIFKRGKSCSRINADEIRKNFNDWDFSEAGRIRQSWRMYKISLEVNTDYCIVDFVAPLIEMRENFNPDITIWVDTIKNSRYPDTDAIFVKPSKYDMRVTTQNAKQWAEIIVEHILEREND
jgi:adenylylsulfate kinase